MGERAFYQSLTKQDRITVVLYRAGIVLSTAIICLFAFLAVRGVQDIPSPASGPGGMLLLVALYISVGLSVFFIHLYIGKFHRILKKIYYVAVACLIALFVIGNGNPVAPLMKGPHLSALLLLPLSLCLGFVTAKEAFCFRLLEGYVLAFIMPAYIFYYALGLSTSRGTMIGIGIVAFLLLLFCLRKVFQPLHYDIGDKSAYQP